MQIISTSIEIAAPPATVRDKFLDFPSMPKYTPSGFIRSITPADTTKTPSSLLPGDKLNIAVGYGKWKFSAIVQENSPSLFSWSGSLLAVFTGEHRFRFEEIPASTDSGTSMTRLVHEERFTGLLAGVMGDGVLGRMAGMKEDTERGFDGFNKDFKGWVERAVRVG